MMMLLEKSRASWPACAWFRRVDTGEAQWRAEANTEAEVDDRIDGVGVMDLELREREVGESREVPRGTRVAVWQLLLKT